MTTPSANDLLPDELAALMHFYAEAGVAWLSEDKPVDRFAEMRSIDQPLPGSFTLRQRQMERDRLMMRVQEH